jgi:dihydroflavonol-4-reductase
MKILFVIPPGLMDVVTHHEATTGMGALVPAEVALGAAGFLYPPQTVAACVAAARAAGMAATVLDGTRARAPAGFAQEVARESCDVLGVLVSQGTAFADANFLRLLRQAGRGGARAPLLLFGPSAHLVAGTVLTEGLADAALLGEPEGAFAEAVSRLAAGRLGRSVVAGELRPELYNDSGLLSNLDALPLPAWDAVPWQPYEMVSLLSSRGCPDGCHYCAYIVAQGHRARVQSIGRTLAEWEWLAREVRPPYLLVRDPVFAANRPRAQALCQGIASRNIQIPWACESRPEHFDRELLRLLKAAGCVTVKIGMETGDPGLLSGIGRLADGQRASDYVHQVRRVAAECQRAGLRCRVFVIAGLPGQSTAALARTEAELRRLAPEAIIHATPYQRHPGTGLSAPSASVSPDMLERLRHANRPAASLWRRVVRRALGSLGAGEQGSGGAEERRGRGAGGQEVAPWLPGTSRSTPPPSTPAFDWSKTRVFLTGGNGFLGGHVAQALVEGGAEVLALVRTGSDPGALGSLPVKIVRGDLVQPSAWLEALPGCQLCFHVAALYASADEAESMYAVNVRGTSILLAACAAAGIRRVIHTSTIGTVGRLPGNALPDETALFNLWDRASHYVRSKYLGELVARSWNGTELEVVIVKPTAPVGTGDARPSATGRRILAAMRGEVTSYPPGGVNHVPARDVAAGHLLAATRGTPGESYILGHSGGNLDHAAFLQLVAEAAGTPLLAPPAPRAGAMGQLPDALTADPSRAIRELGLPQSDLLTVFREAVMWYRQHDRES